MVFLAAAVLLAAPILAIDSAVGSSFSLFSATLSPASLTVTASSTPAPTPSSDLVPRAAAAVNPTPSSAPTATSTPTSTPTAAPTSTPAAMPTASASSSATASQTPDPSAAP